MKKRVFNIFTLLVCVVMLVCFTGCSDNAGDKGNGNDGKTGYVEFSCSDSSRTVLALNTPEYPVESLYWTYTAEKTDDGADVGSTTVQKVVDGRYMNLPGISASNVNNRIGPLSCGEWKFTIYGYLYPTDVDVNTGVARKISDSDNVLIYKGVKSGTVTNSANPATHYDPFNVNVDYKQDKAFLSLGEFKLTVPEGQSFIASSTSPATLIVRLLDVTTSASPKLIAISKTELTSPVSAGNVTLGNFEFVTDDGSAGGTVSRNIYANGSIAIFRFIAEYSGQGFEPGRYNATGITVDDLNDPTQRDVVTPLKDFAPVGDFSGYEFKFTHPGVNSKFQGNLDYLIPASGDSGNMEIKVAVAQVGENYYTTLYEAARNASGNVVKLLMNVEFGTTETTALDTSVTVNPNGKVIIGEKIADGVTLTVKPENSDSRVYAFKGGKLDLFKYSGTNVNISTSENGSTYSDVTVNAVGDTVVHTGAASKVTVTNVQNYSLDANVGTIGDVILSAGSAVLGNNVKITNLSVSPGVVLKAHEFTDVSNYSYNGTSLKSSACPTAQSQVSGASGSFYEIKLTYNSSVKYIYGIEGMKVKLPAIADAFGTGSKNMYWYTEADKTNLSGAKIDNNSEFVCGGTVYTVDGTDAVIGVIVTDLYAQVYPTS